MENQRVIILVKETHKKDQYDEDDYGRETHYLEGSSVLCEVECDILELKDKVNGIMEANADNPPYDSYYVILAYYKDSKIIIPKQAYGYGGDD